MDGESKKILAAMRDVKIECYHQILQALDLLHILVLVVDTNGRVAYSNRPAKQNLGDLEYISTDLAEKNTVLLRFIAKFSHSENAFPIFQEVYEDNSDIWYRITSDRLLLPNGQMFYLHILEDISNWKINERQLMISATTDLMTGTYNRNVGLEELGKILKRIKNKEIHSVAFIDIDGLKTINDSFGHNEGDYTIETIAKILLSSIRGTDLVCRYGGDEFLIILKNCTEIAAEKMISRMQKELAHVNRRGQKPYTLSFSYGIASFSSNSVSQVSDLLKRADQKMYRCKTLKRQEMQKSGTQRHSGLT